MTDKHPSTTAAERRRHIFVGAYWAFCLAVYDASRAATAARAIELLEQAAEHFELAAATRPANGNGQIWVEVLVRLRTLPLCKLEVFAAPDVFRKLEQLAEPLERLRVEIAESRTW